LESARWRSLVSLRPALPRLRLRARRAAGASAGASAGARTGGGIAWCAASIAAAPTIVEVRADGRQSAMKALGALAAAPPFSCAGARSGASVEAGCQSGGRHRQLLRKLGAVYT
jgi:hypothetical protein